MLSRLATMVPRGAHTLARRGLATAAAPSNPALLLYTAGTPNGHKASVLLEELKAVYGLEYG